jgi:hypothetical protein
MGVLACVIIIAVVVVLFVMGKAGFGGGATGEPREKSA